MTTTSRSIYAVAGIRKDRLSEESAIDLKVETKVEWYLLQTQPLSSSSTVVDLPLSEGNPLLSKYVDMKIEFETEVRVPANTIGYCLIFHDKYFEYNPLTTEVRQIM